MCNSLQRDFSGGFKNETLKAKCISLSMYMPCLKTTHMGILASHLIQLLTQVTTLNKFEKFSICLMTLSAYDGFNN